MKGTLYHPEKKYNNGYRKNVSAQYGEYNLYRLYN